MKPELLTVLKKEIEQTFGRKIKSYRDCIHLVDDVYQKTDLNVNVNTIRRFFGLVKTDYAPSHSTILILSKYCGFNSVDDLDNISAPVESDNDIKKQEVYHFLISLFKTTPVAELYVPAMESIVQETIAFLERNPSLIDRFQREAASTAAGQFYYYERCVNMDRLNGYYGDGFRYYLRGKHSNEARLFVNSMQVFRYWLTNEQTLLEKHMKDALLLNIDNDFSPHILARFFAARLYYSNVKGEQPEKVLADANKYYNTLINTKKAITFPIFELILCEALTLTNNKNDAIEWLKRGKTHLRETKDLGSTKFTFWENILVKSVRPRGSKYSFIFLKNDKKKNSVNFFLDRSYYKILDLCFRLSPPHKRDLNCLIEVTGFRRFYMLSKGY